MYLEHRLSAVLQLHLHSGFNTWLRWIWQKQMQEARQIFNFWIWCDLYGMGCLTVCTWHNHINAYLSDSFDQYDTIDFNLPSLCKYNVCIYVFIIMMTAKLQICTKVHRSSYMHHINHRKKQIESKHQSVVRHLAGLFWTGAHHLQVWYVKDSNSV